MVVVFGKGENDYYSLKISTSELPQTLAFVEEKFHQFFEGNAFDYFFLDEAFNAQYQSDQRLSKVLGIFGLIAVFIACLGLYGLATFTAQLRTREIGIRKVMGASPFQIVTLLSGDFLKLVITAFVIAIPLGWWLMNDWLKEFAYRIEIGPKIFLIAGALAILIAVLATGFRALRAAVSNPVDALRSE